MLIACAARCVQWSFAARVLKRLQLFWREEPAPPRQKPTDAGQQTGPIQQHRAGDALTQRCRVRLQRFADLLRERAQAKAGRDQQRGKQHQHRQPQHRRAFGHFRQTGQHDQADEQHVEADDERAQRRRVRLCAHGRDALSSMIA